MLLRCDDGFIDVDENLKVNGCARKKVWDQEIFGSK
jgi:hypothetical protein